MAGRIFVYESNAENLGLHIKDHVYVMKRKSLSPTKQLFTLAYLKIQVLNSTLDWNVIQVTIGV